MVAYKRCQLPWASLSNPAGKGNQGAEGGGTRRFVACSKAYASSMRRGSAHDIAVKLTPYGAGRALNPGGNDGVGAFGTKPNGTMTVG